MCVWQHLSLKHSIYQTIDKTDDKVLVDHQHQKVGDGGLVVVVSASTCMMSICSILKLLFFIKCLYNNN